MPNPSPTPARRKSFGEKADLFLKNFYESFGAVSTVQKINVLELMLGGASNFYAFGGELNEDMKLACLEYEYLEKSGEITLVEA